MGEKGNVVKSELQEKVEKGLEDERFKNKLWSTHSLFLSSWEVSKLRASTLIQREVISPEFLRLAGMLVDLIAIRTWSCGDTDSGLSVGLDADEPKSSLPVRLDGLPAK